MSWKDEPLLTWLSGHNLSWGDDRILDWNDVFPRGTEADILQFVVAEHRSSNTSIDMRMVVGQWDHYAGQTWIDALQNPQYKPGKMRDAIAKADSNPNYYFNGDIKNGIHLCSTDGASWYSNTGGNHRTVIAKFLSEMHYEKSGHYPLVAGISTTRYVIDHESFDLFKALLAYREHGIHISVHPRRPNAPLVFHIGDFRFNRRGKFEHLNPDQFRSYARWVLKNDGVLTKWDMLAHWRQFWFGDPVRLVFFA